MLGPLTITKNRCGTHRLAQPSHHPGQSGNYYYLIVESQRIGAALTDLLGPHIILAKATGALICHWLDTHVCLHAGKLYEAGRLYEGHPSLHASARSKYPHTTYISPSDKL